MADRIDNLADNLAENNKAIQALTRALQDRSRAEQTHGITGGHSVPGGGFALNSLSNYAGQNAVSRFGRNVSRRGGRLNLRAQSFQNRAKKILDVSSKKAAGLDARAKSLADKAAKRLATGQTRSAAILDKASRQASSKADRARKSGTTRAAKFSAAAKSAGNVGFATKLAGGTALAVGALIAFSKAVERATDQQIEAMRKYASVSTAMAFVMAERDMREMRRNIEKGEALAGSTRELTQAEQERKDTTKPIEILADKIYNGFLTVGNKIATEIAKPVAELAEVIDKWIEDGEDKDPRDKLDAGSTEFARTELFRRNRMKVNDPWFTRPKEE